MGRRDSIPHFFIESTGDGSLIANTDTITIECDDRCITDCVSVIIVPERALAEPGYIKTMTAKADANAKHEFHALAQMAYYQYQDDELELGMLSSPCKICWRTTREKLEVGMLIYRDTGSVLHVLMHDSLNRKKMLEAANRYCTRWVRLDI